MPLAAPLSPSPPAFPRQAHPAVAKAAEALSRRLGLPPALPRDTPGPGLNLDVADGPWKLAPSPAPRASAWMWARLGEEEGTLTASSPALLYALAHLLADGLPARPGATLSEGVLIEPAFPFQRPLFDTVLTQVARTSRGFAPETYVERLARTGFTHLEVNGLAFHVPFEFGVPTEFYSSFYTYCPGLHHFVDSPLTRGLYPPAYLQANLNRLRRLAALGQAYGLRPGLLCFEPRSLPEHFFQRHPTLRGARIDHPFRSHLPRYTLAQDHPVTRDHYRHLMRSLMEAVPELDYLSVWTNDSGAGFEHTASLYVGRNGGPYLIREWRDHTQIAEAAAQSALRWLRLMRETAAEVNPGFEVLLRIEPFKQEHDVIMAGLGDGLGIEAPSLLVRGYDLPYHHPHYPEQSGLAGSIFHTTFDPREKTLLEAHRARGIEPKISYSAGSSFNMEPLLGIPHPRLLHRKLTALRETGFKAVSAFGGLLHLEKTPFWPHPGVIRAAQFTPERPADTVLADLAERWAGPADAGALVTAWDAVEEAIRYFPVVPLYSHFGFVWLRTWVRPLVPNLEAIPSEERRYYEDFMVGTANNPNINDLGRDVLFELISEESGRRMAEQFDRNALPRLAAALDRLDAHVSGAATPGARAVFTDLRDRVRALQCWATTQRNTCAWVAGVYGYRRADSEEERQRHRDYLQCMIDLEYESTRRLLDLWEHSDTEFMLVSDVGETSFVYGENFGELLRRKLALTEAYRHYEPYIDETLIWRLP
jgi:hypothetical protein